MVYNANHNRKSKVRVCEKCNYISSEVAFETDQAIQFSKKLNFP